jgi:hypothetical protein
VSYVSPAIRKQFESLSIDLKNHIITRGANLHNINDLMAVLADIIVEDEIEGGL